MTREVINELKKYTVGKKNSQKAEISVLALNRLIFALEEQEPCEDVPDINDGNIYKCSCGDAISRQGVLNKKELVKLEDGQSFYCISPEDVKTLPPVIPQTEIIRCSQCKYAEVADSEDSQDGYTCQFHRGSIWFSGSYCSWAERRQDG